MNSTESKSKTSENRSAAYSKYVSNGNAERLGLQTRPIHLGNSFKQIPILHEGRIKPLGSFARIQLKRITGSETWQGQSASEWLIRTLFDPASEQDKIFTLRDPALKEMLGLPTKQKYFNLHDINPGLQKTTETVLKLATQDEEKPLTKTQQKLLKLHENARTLHDLHRSLSLLTPLRLNDSEEPQNYREHKLAYANAKQNLLTIIKNKGQDPDKYNEQEKTIALFAFQMDQIRADGIRTHNLRILPATKEWVSPWQYEEQLEPAERLNTLLTHWQAMGAAYRAKDPQSWNKAVNSLLKELQTLELENYNPTLIKLELAYNTIQPFDTALVLYILTLLLLTTTLFNRHCEEAKPTRQSKIPPLSSRLLRFARNDGCTITLTFATLSLIAGITARIIILGRPPVSTLYESTLFVTAIASLLGLFIAYKQNNRLISTITAALGAGLMLLAPILIKEGESMEMLVAVLNTNFWLATHVVCITMGYGVCMLAASLAHITLTMHCFQTTKTARQTMLSNSYKTALAALLLTAIGTVLGGIWADQSWGRFWGWDPKENGALLIVLWLVWILHGRLSKHLGDLSFSALLAALNIVVALTWFGVNLLGVGLHSYGFTSGLATGLFIFCTLQALIIAALTFVAYRKRS